MSGKNNFFNMLLFFLVLLFYGIYPVWFIPTIPVFYQYVLLNFFVLIIGGIVYCWPDLNDISSDIIYPRISEINFNFFGVTIVIGAVLAHIPFWVLPVVTGDDMQSHISPAATVLGHVYSFIPPIFVKLLALATLIGIVVVLRFLRHNFKKANFVFWISVFAINLYAFLLLKTQLINKMGMWQSVFRYPPAAKLVYLTGYSVLGVNEIVGRGIQFIFLLGTVLAVGRTVKLISRDADFNVILFLTLFFPTFFHFTNYALLTNGLVFFFAAISYFFLKSLKDEKSISWVIFLLSIGFLYKRLILGLIPIIFFYLIYLYFKNSITLVFLKKYLKNLFVPLLIGLPFTVIGSILKIRGTGSNIGHIFSPVKMLQNSKDFFETLGPFLSVLIVLSAAWCFVRRKKHNVYWLVLVTGYYLMISLTAANGYIRHTQPVYLGLFYFFVVALTDFVNWAKQKNKMILILAGLLLFGELGYSNFFAVNRVQRTVLSNRFNEIYPYDELMKYFRDIRKFPITVYAPCDVEPSHFYLAKYQLTGKISWDRTAPSDVNLGSIVSRASKYDYLCLLDIGTEYNYYKDVIKDILKSEQMELVRVFDYKGHRMFLFKYPKGQISTGILGGIYSI
ncbi:MAG: hypothetical protein CVU78_01240 [Elusimicrobia bacterium HGW-Elusimicrobia-2]|nr:MAG: hypothetical protein CVU78_01240 [Elusimicrobia bacterium HGW-Elusimicrobia-2]